MPDMTLRDWLYMAMAGAQVSGSLLLDLVPFYPRALWDGPSAPLRFLAGIRAAYTTHTSDPYFPPYPDRASPIYPAATAWFLGFLYIKAFVNLPLSVYVLSSGSARVSKSGKALDDGKALDSGKALQRLQGLDSAKVELAALVLACVSAMGATTCCVNLWFMGPERLPPSKKPTLLYGIYMPFVIIPVIMALDMVFRLLARVHAAQKSKRN